MKRLLFLRKSLFYNALLKDVDKVVKPSFSTSAKAPNKVVKFSLVSASVGAALGIGYSGYTHYQVNANKKKPLVSDDHELPLLLDKLPDVQPTRSIVIPNDESNLKLVLFQYQTCPFCCKVRAFLDYHGISYDVVEVDAVLRQSIKWSQYKKVPILLAKTEKGYQQLNDSSVIISALSSYLSNKKEDISDILAYYPVMKYTDQEGKTKQEIVNKYFRMYQHSVNDATYKSDASERKWREWADGVLVHTLSPNVYRSLDEAFQAFNWFADVGLWREHFPKWEVGLMVNVGAVAMWLISKRLKKRHCLKGDVRESLYDECNRWVKELRSKNTPFMGGLEPNLSDISTYGILNSIEGCDAFADLRKHTNIGEWYDTMKVHVSNHKGLKTA